MAGCWIATKKNEIPDRVGDKFIQFILINTKDHGIGYIAPGA
jgi:hypothetical protein